ncbi:MAG: AbrB/MazE/SpoVT family DNA-binding domain-containing protein [Anaerolineae bacterium]|nr:AbrB/MazE/SpoVT family DNA-binding domain-containing protein [Anaerolineae bacterium]NIN99670.1 AbrB/MazE/SpoVT family DNA-binding domain-containing protein [Anaerolineae bacterium]NIQ82523.1 AbrB/MazE/SpoVT family DNA-binding domain-containing protein [Anaerolineae bacterium]
MPRKIFRTGNSMVVSLPKETLEVLNLGEGSEVSVELDRERGEIVITPLGRELPGVDSEFARQVAEFIEQYRPALEALSKG